MRLPWQRIDALAREWAALPAKVSDPYAYRRAVARLKAGIASVEDGRVVCLD